MTEASKSKNVFEQLNISVVEYLESKNGVCKLETERRRPAERPALLLWEQKNTVFLPEDLKSFYMTTDGFQLTWSVKIDNGPIPIGRMYIHSISKLLKIGGNSSNTLVNPSLADLHGDSDDESSDCPTFDSTCKVYELDPCDGYGKVCLVYKDNKTGGTEQKVEVWLLDRSLRWHYIADSFTSYYRLMIMHLGLPQWQYAFTDIGLCQQSKQWFNLFAPLRLELDAELSMSGQYPNESNSSMTRIDVMKVFQGKTDKKKPVPAQTQSQQSHSLRKKTNVASAKIGQQSGLKTSGSASQLSGRK